jgi:hypothetical protein
VWGTQGSPTYTDDLALFLGRVAAWSGEKPPNSYVNIHCITPDSSPRKAQAYAARGGGRAFASMDEYGDILDYVRNATRNGDGVYLCMSSRSAYEQATTKGGKSYRRALRKAPRSYPVALKALWLDLDVKPDAYPSQREALRAALPFFDKLGLPPSMIVSTGWGIHAYVIFDQLITPAQWQPLANALIAAAQEAGIKLDVKVSRDDDRIMRLPGTVNAKVWTDQKPTKILSGNGRDFTLAEVETALSKWRGLTSGVGSALPRSVASRIDPAVIPPRRPITSGPLFARVSADLEKIRVVTSFDLLRTACPVVADSDLRRGDGDPEPLWFELAKLCSYVVDGRQHFHQLSDGDARYVASQTDLKYDQVQKEGWPSCAAIEQSCAAAGAICKRCQFYGDTSLAPKPSPIHFATRGLPGTVAAALPMQATVQPLNINVNGVNGHAYTQAFVASALPVNQILLPAGYAIDPNQKLRLVGPQGQYEAEVFGNALYDIRLTQDKATGQQLRLMADIGTGKPATKTFSIGMIRSSMRETQKEMGSAGILFDDYGIARKFTMDLQTFIQTNRRVYEESHNGWEKDHSNAITGFSYGGYTYMPGGAIEAPISESEMMRPLGDINMWRQAGNFYVGHGCVEMEALMACAYAAPLLPFASVDGVIVYGHSGGTGFGKTASLETLQSVWGPRRAVIGSATTNYVMAELAARNNLPAVFDEFIKRKDSRSARQFTELVYDASGGQVKGRLDRSSRMVERQSMQAMLVTAGNGSLVELASTRDSNAIAARIYEIRMSDAIRRMQNQQDDVARIRAIEDTNYGVAGAIYADALGRNHGGLQPLVLDTIKDFQRAAGIGEEGRFWLAAAATIFVGASISKRLNLQLFDTQRLRNFLIDQVKLQRSSLADAQLDTDDPAVALTKVIQFLNEHRQAIIISKTMPKRGGAQQAEMPTNPEEVRRARFLVARHATADGVIEISEEKFRAWCQHDHQQISYVGLRRALEKGGHITRPHKGLRLTRGLVIEVHSLQEKVLQFDLNAPANSALVEGVDDV